MRAAPRFPVAGKKVQSEMVNLTFFKIRFTGQWDIKIIIQKIRSAQHLAAMALDILLVYTGTFWTDKTDD